MCFKEVLKMVQLLIPLTLDQAYIYYNNGYDVIFKNSKIYLEKQK